MGHTGESITVLLGAGASVDAGIPASIDLTRRIADEISSGMGRYHGTTQAMNTAIGAMIAHDTAHGGDAFRGIDVERLFSAVQMLAARDDLEVSPFVASWIGALETIGIPRRFPAFFKDSFEKALTSRFSGDLERLFKEAVVAVAGSRDSELVFARLESQMISTLQAAARVDAHRVDYLSPLLTVEPRPVRIATLNYDRSIEILARRAEMTLDTGIEQWSGGFEWGFRTDADVRLLKMHGSVDWILESTGVGHEGLPEDRVVVNSAIDARELRGGTLGVVFGQRGKLRSDGPFLAMLRAFSEFLASTDRLVVVGYSFRDDHINAAIRRWFNQHPAPAVTIIDPGINAESRGAQDRSFRAQFLRAITTWGPSGNGPTVKPPHALFALTAAEGLRTIFGDGPTLGTLADERGDLDGQHGAAARP